MTRKRQVFERLIKMGRTRCRYCPEAKLSVLTLEHLTPTSRGGAPWNLRNLDVTCYRCNLAKGKMNDLEFKNHIRQIGGVHRLPKFSEQTAAFVAGRAKQIRASNGRFRAFDSLVAMELERLTR